MHPSYILDHPNMQAEREGIKNSIFPFYLSLALKRQDTFLTISLYE